MDFGRVQTIDRPIFDEHLFALWQTIYEPHQLKLPVPEALKVVESQIQELMERFVLVHHRLSEPASFIPDLNEFIDFILAHAAIHTPMVSNVKPSDLDPLQLWQWLVFLMTRLDVKLHWIQEFKDLFERYLPDYQKDHENKLSA